MKVPGIEEIDETYLDGIAQAIQARTDGVTWNDDIRRAGLLAVFETHVGPMLAATWLRCIAKIEGKVDELDQLEADEHAGQIISQLKEPRHG